MPPAEPGHRAHGLRRPVRDPLHRCQTHLSQAAASDRQHSARPRPLHPVPALRALRRPDRRRSLHRPPGPWRRPCRGRDHRRALLRADRPLRLHRSGLLRRRGLAGRPRDDPRRGPSRPRSRSGRARRRSRRRRRSRLRAGRPGRPRGPRRLRTSLRLLLLGQHHPDLPGRGAHERSLPLPLPPHGSGVHRFDHRARRLRLRHPRRHASRRRAAPSGRQRPAGQRGVDHRQGPLRIRLVGPARPPARSARAQRSR